MSDTIIALDTETYYDSECNVSKLGPHAYTRHPDWNCYLLSVYGADIEYIGSPENFDWNLLRGKKIAAHNAAFDKAQIDALRRKGLDIPPLDWMCTADLTAYLGVKRSLDSAVKHLYGVDISKEVRKNMVGKTFDNLQDWDESKLATNKVHRKKKEDYEALIQYALDDAKWCYKIARDHVSKWPRREMDLSKHTREMGAAGVAIDEDKLDKFISHLVQIKHQAEEELPWDAPYLSKEKIASFCIAAGVTPPASIAKTAWQFESWLQEHENSKVIGWVAPLKKLRICSMHLERMRSIKARLQDGILQFGLKYFGAHTGRWSGDQGINFQNFPRQPWEGLDFRSLIIPRVGHKFIIADFAQIEARVLLWLVGDDEQLSQVKKGISVYEAHARNTMGWDGGPLKAENLDLYQLAKARVLGLGFGCGPAKFQAVAKIMAGLDLTEIECQNTVQQFRASNPKIVGLWKKQQAYMEASFQDVDFGFSLPSGRVQGYYNLCRDAGQIKGEMVRGSGARKLYGGLLTENYVQSVARDVLADKILALEHAGHRVAYHVHDEVIVEVPDMEADVAMKDIVEILSTPTGWYESLPLGVEAEISTYYTK